MVLHHKTEWLDHASKETCFGCQGLAPPPWQACPLLWSESYKRRMGSVMLQQRNCMLRSAGSN